MLDSFIRLDVLSQLQPQKGTEVTKQAMNVLVSFVLFVGPESKERIIIGAHCDTAGPLPGADDNASGVAGLIELARLFARQQPPLRVELVAFNLEEPPYFRTTAQDTAEKLDYKRMAMVVEGVYAAVSELAR